MLYHPGPRALIRRPFATPILTGAADWSITEKTLTITNGDRGLVYRGTP